MSEWDTVLEGNGYVIERRVAGPVDRFGVGFAYLRLVIDGRPLVQSAGKESENGRLLHLLIGVLGRDGVKEALLAGPDVPEDAP